MRTSRESGASGALILLWHWEPQTVLLYWHKETLISQWGPVSLWERNPCGSICKKNKRNQPFWRGSFQYNCLRCTKMFNFKVGFSNHLKQPVFKRSLQSFNNQCLFTWVLRVTIMFLYDHLMNMSRVSQRCRSSKHSQYWVDRNWPEKKKLLYWDK